MNIQKKVVHIVVQNKIKASSVKQLIETNFDSLSEHEESPLFLKHLFNSFINYDYDINLITWKDFKNLNVNINDIFVIPPWYVSGNRDLLKNRKFNQELVDIISYLPEKKLCHVITLTRSNSCWGVLTDLFYKGNKNGFIRSEIHSLKLKQHHPLLTKGIGEIIQTSQFSNDFFGRITGDGKTFITLISKIPKSLPSLEFNLFGYMRFTSGSYLFNIDIANSGAVHSHQKLFLRILDNVIQFLSNKE